jgi:hypothetical protein
MAHPAYHEGTVLESCDARSRGKRVKVAKHLGGDRYRLENVETGRISTVSTSTLQTKYRHIRASTPDRRGLPERRTTRPQPVLNERQEVLLNIVKQAFSDFHKRGQHFYLGGGISTSHAVVKVIADIDALQIFWPAELVKKSVFGGHSYQLAPDVMRRVQDRIRDTLKQLHDRGLLEKVGNTDERRWKPVYDA